MITDSYQRSLQIQAKIGSLAWKVTESVLNLPLPPSAPQTLSLRKILFYKWLPEQQPQKKLKSTPTFFLSSHTGCIQSHPHQCGLGRSTPGSNFWKPLGGGLYIFFCHGKGWSLPP